MTRTFSTQNYKGTRDFYPFQSLVSPGKDLNNIIYREYIFDTWRKTLLNLGFSEYDASIIENADIYIAKSGEELGSKQLYSFEDKGGRSIALRPEMTPTLARLVADQYENIRYPLRWFSIPNCFRYEQPQKGRLREHWQLNVDIIGLEEGESDLEILYVAGQVMQAFGASTTNYSMLFNSRDLLASYFTSLKIDSDKFPELFGLFDRFRKISPIQFEEDLYQILNQNADQTNQILGMLDFFYPVFYRQKGTGMERGLFEQLDNFPQFASLLGRGEGQMLGLVVEQSGAKYDPTIIRGQAYYTGMIFEVFDCNSGNPRSLIGGGRYDNLLDLYGKSRLPAIGFGSGDVTWLEFLKNWKLLDGYTKFEEWKKNKYPLRVGIIPKNQQDLVNVYTKTIPNLQKLGKAWDIDYSFDRSSKKRWETLKKRGCGEIIEL